MRLQVKELSKTYFAGIPIFQGLTFDVPIGEVTTVYGTRLSGKTTLMRVLAGLESYEGSITLADGSELSTHRPKELDTALFFETKPLFRHRTSYYNIGYPLKLRHVEHAMRHVRIMHVAGLLGIHDTALWKPVYMLTPTEAALVQLGRMFVRDEGGLLLLDNPLRHFSGDERKHAFEVLCAVMRSTANTYVYATDSMDEILAFAPAPTVDLDRQTDLPTTN